MQDRIYEVEDLTDFDTYKDPELNKIIVEHYRFYNRTLFNALKIIHNKTNDANAKKFSSKVLARCSSEWQKNNK